MPGNCKQKLNRGGNIIIKVEVKENNILLDKESRFVGHFIWIKGIAKKSTFALNDISPRYTKQQLSEMQREMNRSQIQQKTTQL